MTIQGTSLVIFVQVPFYSAAQIFGVQCTTLRFSVAFQGAAQIFRVQCSPLRFSVALQGAAQIFRVEQSPLGCSVALQGGTKPFRVEHRSLGCSVALQGAAQNFRVQRSHVRVQRSSAWHSKEVLLTEQTSNEESKEASLNEDRQMYCMNVSMNVLYVTKNNNCHPTFFRQLRAKKLNIERCCYITQLHPT